MAIELTHNTLHLRQATTYNEALGQLAENIQYNEEEETNRTLVITDVDGIFNDESLRALLSLELREERIRQFSSEIAHRVDTIAITSRSTFFNWTNWKSRFGEAISRDERGYHVEQANTKSFDNICIEGPTIITGAGKNRSERFLLSLAGFTDQILDKYTNLDFRFAVPKGERSQVHEHMLENAIKKAIRNYDKIVILDGGADMQKAFERVSQMKENQYKQFFYTDLTEVNEMMSSPRVFSKAMRAMSKTLLALIAWDQNVNPD